MKNMDFFRDIIKKCHNNDISALNIKEIATAILSAQCHEDGYVKIVDICTSAGFKIFVQDLPQDINGYIAMDMDLHPKIGSKVMVLNNSLNGKHRRETLAKLFGYYLFDSKNMKDFKYYKLVKKTY